MKIVTTRIKKVKLAILCFMFFLFINMSFNEGVLYHTTKQQKSFLLKQSANAASNINDGTSEKKIKIGLFDNTKEYPPISEIGISVGTTRDGYLKNGSICSEDYPDKLQILPKQRARNLNYGSYSLIETLSYTSNMLYNLQIGMPLYIGDLSSQQGGNIAWSVSHNSGRDADLAFFYKNKNGDSVIPKDFMHFSSKGTVISDPNIIFDVEKNWLLVKTLIENPFSNIQWLFIYNPLKDMLIQYAESIFENKETIEKARELLKQPGDSAPHNDHLHLRILCSDDDILEGCVNNGKIPSWLPEYSNDEARKNIILSYLYHIEIERRLIAINLSSELEIIESLNILPMLLTDASSLVRIATALSIENYYNRLKLENSFSHEKRRTIQDIESQKYLLDKTWLLDIRSILKDERDPCLIESFSEILIRNKDIGSIFLFNSWLESELVFSKLEIENCKDFYQFIDKNKDIFDLELIFPQNKDLSLREIAEIAINKLSNQN